MHCVDELVVHLADCNGHVSRCMGGCDGVHREFGVGQGRMLLDVHIENELYV